MRTQRKRKHFFRNKPQTFKRKKHIRKNAFEKAFYRQENISLLENLNAQLNLTALL